MFEHGQSFTNLLHTTHSDACLVQVTRAFEHGESPRWDQRNKRLYFVDAYAGNVHAFEPISGKLNTMRFQGYITSVFTVEDDTKLFIVSNNKSLMGVKWSGETNDAYKQTILVEVEKHLMNRFNDGAVDNCGRLWIGTMAVERSPGDVKPNQGNVYRVNKHCNMEGKPHLIPKLIIPGVTISNGIAWNNDSTLMYYIDSTSKKVVAYNFDIECGTVKLDTLRVIYDFGERFAGLPDGMTVDRDDNLWVALYGGGCIVHINPRSRSVLRVIAIPSRYVTSVAFGGLELDTLYVTTSRTALSADDRLWQPAAGALFAVKGIVPGYAGTHTNIISAAAMDEIDCSNGNDDLWCQSTIEMPKDVEA